MPTNRHANEVQRHSNAMPAAHPGPSGSDPATLADFRPALADQIHDALRRILTQRKAEDVAALVDRKRSTVYRWQAEPGDVPISALPVLISLDPDPELGARLAGILLTQTAGSALAREASGRARIIIEEIGPGRTVRR